MYWCTHFENLGVDPTVTVAADSDDDDDDDVLDEKASEGGGDVFLPGLGRKRKALIFKDEGGERSYSSTRFTRSSSEVIEIRASRSSVGS